MTSRGQAGPTEARTYLDERRRLFEKHEAKLSADARAKLSAALGEVQALLDAEGGDAAPKPGKRLAAAMKALDAAIERDLGVSTSGKSTVREYAESIVVAVLIAVVLRAFVVEAFKIPTGSMIPTLAVGDHIFVNKFIYGLRIPLTNAWFTEWGTPARGDVIVFRYPRDLSKDYIKRVVGVAGDRVRVSGEEVFVNGRKLARADAKMTTYIDEGEEDDAPAMGLPVHVTSYAETRSGDGPAPPYTVIYKPGNAPNRLSLPGGAALPGLACTEDRPEAPGECTVEPGYVFVMGDNRDNSSDSRVWGGVPTSYVKGKAMFVWWSRGAHTGVRWERFGNLVD